MAGELQIGTNISGSTVYAVLRTATGTVWNGTAFEAFNAANWTTYDIALTEQGTSGYFVGTMPAVAAGFYSITYHRQAGAGPVITDQFLASEDLEWSGTAIVYQSGDSFARIGADGAGLTALGDTRLANLNATVSSRLAAASYTAPDNAGIASTQTRVQTALPNVAPGATGGLSIVGSAMTLTGATITSIASAVWSTVIVSTRSASWLLKKIGSLAGLGLTTDARTNSEKFYEIGQPATTPNITVTVDSSGNRTAIVHGDD